MSILELGLPPNDEPQIKTEVRRGTLQGMIFVNAATSMLLMEELFYFSSFQSSSRACLF